MYQFVVIFACTIMANGFVVTWDEDLLLPTQGPVLWPSAGMVRSWGTSLEFIDCPDGTQLSKDKNKCVFTHSSNTQIIRHLPRSYCQVLNETSEHDVYPFASDCRFFVTCADSQIFISECNDGLLFNAEKSYCDFPRQSGCCEYCADDPSRLVESTE